MGAVFLTFNFQIVVRKHLITSTIAIDQRSEDEPMKKTLLFTVLAFSIAAFFLFDLQDIFTLTFLKTEISQFRQWQQASPVWMISVFFIIYVVMTAFSFPGATLMTLAAGALFGLVNGTVISSFASTIGATLAFLTSRYLFREQVQSRFRNNFV